MPPITASKRLLNRKELVEIVGLSYPSIWRLMCEDQFPRSVVLGRNRVAWFEAEVDAWLESLERRRLKGDPVDGGAVDSGDDDSEGADSEAG